MSRRIWGILGIIAGLAGPVRADVVSPDSSYIRVTFTGANATAQSQFPPTKYLTIAPDGSGETLTSIGVLIEVWVKNALGVGIVGVPAGTILLFSSALCICQGGNNADFATIQGGYTKFTGTIRGGGCASSLVVWVSGVPIGTTSGLNNVAVNSWDHVPSSPCFVDAGDLAALAPRLGAPANYTICSDFNEDGFIDAGDIASFAQHLGAACN